MVKYQTTSMITLLPVMPFMHKLPRVTFTYPIRSQKKFYYLVRAAVLHQCYQCCVICQLYKVIMKLFFFHCAHTEQDLIAHSSIDSLAIHHGNCQVIYTLTQQVNPYWQGYQGRVNQRMLANISQLNQFDVYVCGPKGFRQHTQQLLQQLGIKRENYHYESFGERPIEQDIVEQTNVVEKKVENKVTKKPDLYFSKWNKHHQGNNYETLLTQGENAGLILPYSCRAGCCGSCKAKLINGQVKQSTTDGLSKEEQKQGYILLCSCLPLSDVQIQHDQRR